jgi:single-strand DNA-binding protein
MNSVQLIGRLTKDPEVRYTPSTQLAVARFTLAIDRPVGQGKEKQTDFPRIVVFGKQAENCEKHLRKGLKVAVQGRVQTGSYKNNDGVMVYTTDIVADRVEFLEWKDSRSDSFEDSKGENYEADIPADSFQSVDEDVPF